MADKEWSYRKAEVRPEIEAGLPEGWKLKVYHVTSGDSGKKYWVQILTHTYTKTKIGSDDAPVGTKTYSYKLYLCDCNEGRFHAPEWIANFVTGTSQGEPCKHGKFILEALKSE